MKPKVSLVNCPAYRAQDVEESVRRSVDLLGGISRFVSSRETVLLKPNILMDASPEKGITTHPEVVRAAIRLLKGVASKIYCGDSPSVWGEESGRNIEEVYAASGIKDVCREEDVELVSFNKPRMRGTYPLTDWLEKTDRLVSIPKFKTHSFTLLTAGIKNLFGLVVGMYKVRVHRDRPRPDELSRSLVDIYELARPDLNILDGVVAMEGDGPGTSGSLRPMALVAASPDALAMDTVLSYVMGLSAADIPTNREAFARGLGPAALEGIDLVGEPLERFLCSDFKLPATTFLNNLPSGLLNMVKPFLTMRPKILVGPCRVCGLCQKGCPVGAIRQEGQRILIDYKKCISCFCCQEVCPHRAVETQKSLLFRLLGK